MYCPKCGKLIPVDGVFCPGCGYKIQNVNLSGYTHFNQQNINRQSDNQQYQNSQFCNLQQKNNSMNSNTLGIILGVSAAVLVIILCYAIFLGDYSNSAPLDNYGSNIQNSNGRIDLYDDRTMSESRLVKKYDYFKNDFHVYPDTENITIMYLGDDINIMIDEDNGRDYCFLDICIGDPMDSIKANLSGKFKLINRYSSVDGTLFRLYKDKEHENGYLRIYGRETVQSIYYFETDKDMTDKEVW